MDRHCYGVGVVAPIVWMDFGTTVTASAIGYSQRSGAVFGADKVTTVADSFGLDLRSQICEQ